MRNRINFTNERIVVSVMQSMHRSLEEMKALQRMSNRSGVVFYSVESSLPYDAVAEVGHVPGSYGQPVEFRVHFTARKQDWPYATSSPILFVGPNKGSLAGATEVQRSTIDTGDPDITMLDVPKRLMFKHGVIIDNPPPGSVRYVYIKNSVTGTDTGTLSTEVRRE